jgi:hypothetical protein
MMLRATRGGGIQGRHFSPASGSSLFGRTGDEIEVHVGCLDAPTS